MIIFCGLNFEPNGAVSYPAPHRRDVVVICRSELATHFCFFKGNVDPIGSSEQGYGRPKHWPRADPDCDAKGKNNEAQIHWVAGKLIRTGRNKLAIGWRSGFDLGALAAEEHNGPD